MDIKVLDDLLHFHLDQYSQNLRSGRLVGMGN